MIMKPISELIRGIDQVNPFKDSQARNFSNQKLIAEFCPTNTYWDLFNDQHEILIGTRGSGKTILLRMMQYSLLKQLKDPRAKVLIEEKKYVSLYVPTNIEFLRSVNPSETSSSNKVRFFQFGFNCLLVQSLITELKSFILDIDESRFQQAFVESCICEIICMMWFEGKKTLDTLDDVSFAVDNMYHNFNFYNQESDFEETPPVFINSIGKPIQSISKHIFKILNMGIEPIWLVCIDEAEFLDIPHQICINSLFRAYSQGIVIKMATLPFKHITRDTFIKGELAEPDGNDFNYRNIEFDPDGEDFERLTNSLCQSRMSKIIGDNTKRITLSDFLGIVGNDKLIDYYKKEIGAHNIDRVQIERELIEQFSERRRGSAYNKGVGSKLNRKQVYDKFAPIFFIREMYKLNKQGNRTPGFYAGAPMVRKVSEGNPRIFIQIMNQLFEKARVLTLNPKQQHLVLMEFADQHCNITKRLPEYGYQLSNLVSDISLCLQEHTHSAQLKDSGNTFLLSEKLIGESDILKAILLGCAYSRLKIDHNSLLNGITSTTEYSISNVYAMKFWVPMRKAGNPIKWTGIKKRRIEVGKPEDFVKQTEIAFE